jgi:hypothetical protein
MEDTKTNSTANYKCKVRWAVNCTLRGYRVYANSPQGPPLATAASDFMKVIPSTTHCRYKSETLFQSIRDMVTTTSRTLTRHRVSKPVISNCSQAAPSIRLLKISKSSLPSIPVGQYKQLASDRQLVERCCHVWRKFKRLQKLVTSVQSFWS